MSSLDDGTGGTCSDRRVGEPLNVTGALMPMAIGGSRWLHLGYRDLRSMYAQSRLGPLWSMASVLVTAVALGVVFSRLFGLPTEGYFLYLLTGLTVWGLIGRALGEGPSSLVDSRGLLLNTALTAYEAGMRAWWRSALMFLISLPVVLIALMVLDRPSAHALWFLAGVLIVFAFSGALTLLMSLLGVFIPFARYAIPPLSQLLFLLTPIIWTPGLRPEVASLVALNPFYYPVAVVRDPLIGLEVPLGTWSIAIAEVVILCALAWPILTRVNVSVKGQV